MSREKLKARREPYWQRVGEVGQSLGFRPSKVGDAGTWIAKARDAGAGKRTLHSLGDYAQLPANERFGAAQKDARDWFKHLDAGGTVEVLTVAQACERYAVKLEQGINGDPPSPKKAKEARRRFGQYVNHDPVARIQLGKLRKHHVEGWRTRLSDTPAAFQRSGTRGVGRGKGKGTHTRPRAATTVDRDVSPLRSALNLALAEGHVTSAIAWAVPLKTSKAHAQRTLYLERDQRRALLAAIKNDALRDFLAALAALPLRPGAVASLTVGDFNAKQGTLRIGTDKAGAGRVILLPPSTAKMIAVAARNKLPKAPLFARTDGKRWRADEWVRAIKVAAASADLPQETVAYTLRHSAITDLVTDGLDLFTVAKLAGTSVEMIEFHYGHLRQDIARDALAKLAL